MKKLLSITIAFILIFSCFAVTVFAEDTLENFDVFNTKMPIGTFSDRYENFYVDGDQYTRINSSVIEMDLQYYWIIEEKYNYDFYTGESIYIELSSQQKQEIKRVNLKTNQQRTIVQATLTYFDDVEMTIVYLKDSYLEEYNKVVSGNTDTLTINFVYPNYNSVEAQKQQLVGEKTTFNHNQLIDLEDDYDVIANNSDGSMSVVVGKLLIIADEYYYINFKEAGFNEDDLYSGSIGKIADKPIHKITDTQLLEDINKAMEEYYDDDYGVLYDDNATESISIVFFIFVFAVIPLAILVFFLIKAIKSKGIYKKMYFTVVAICLAEIIVFSILAGIVIKASSLDEFDFTLSGRTIEEYADDIGVGTRGEEVAMLKEGFYCGDGDCNDGCTTGYFYRDKNYSEEEAMLKLDLGEKKADFYVDIPDAVIYETDWATNAVINTTEYENGYIVEYEVVGVG